MNAAPLASPVLVAGGGIGGLAAALALSRQGLAVKVLEQAAEIGEIGAGIQLGPNAFAAFDALGIGARARGRAVYTDEMVMHDAIDESLVGRIPVGEAFRARFGNPYAVIHRADVHLSLLEGVQERGGIELLTSTRVARIEQGDAGVTVIDAGQEGLSGRPAMERREHLGRSRLPPRPLPAARRRAIQRRRHVPQPATGGVERQGRQRRRSAKLFRRHLPARPAADPTCRKPGSAEPPPTASRSGDGPSAAPRCSATLPTRRCSTWPRAPAWPWKTR